MSFASKLRGLQEEAGLTQRQICKLTGLCPSSISQYLSGKNEPTTSKKREIAKALNVREDYFDTFSPVDKIEQREVVNLPVELVMKLMRKSKEWVEEGLQNGAFPWGYAVKLKRWSYWISSAKFTECTGIEVPLNDLNEIRNKR